MRWSLFARNFLWATAAWWFGIPTSESHAIAGITGAAIAVQGGLEGINPDEWVKVIYGLFLSVFMGFILGWIIVKLIEFIFRGFNRRKTTVFFQYAQVFGSAGMAFMHGAQDGQKFMGVFLLGVFLAQGNTDVSQFSIPIWLILLCSLVMALGTSVGGYRIIKAVGMDMVKLEKYQGFSADLAAAISLFFASIFGLPVSTTHTKTTSIMGVGAAKRLSNVNWGVVKDMVGAWILTFRLWLNRVSDGEAVFEIILALINKTSVPAYLQTDLNNVYKNIEKEVCNMARKEVKIILTLL